MSNSLISLVADQPLDVMVERVPTSGQAPMLRGRELMEELRVGDVVYTGDFHVGQRCAGYPCWHVLDKVRDEGAGVAKVLLFSDDTWWTYADDGEPIGVPFDGESWRQSRARVWCQVMEREALSVPGLLVVAAEAADGSRGGDSIEGDGVFFLSVGELLYYLPKASQRMVHDGYWTRTVTIPCEGETHALIVNGHASEGDAGHIALCDTREVGWATARPAFWATFTNEAAVMKLPNRTWELYT